MPRSKLALAPLSPAPPVHHLVKGFSLERPELPLGPTQGNHYPEDYVLGYAQSFTDHRLDRSMKRSKRRPKPQRSCRDDQVLCGRIQSGGNEISLGRPSRIDGTTAYEDIDRHLLKGFE